MRGPTSPLPGMETIPETAGAHRPPWGRGEPAARGGAVIWAGGLSPEERRAHQVLTEAREGLDTARLAEATGLPRLDLYRVLERLRLRGLVEAYPGSPVLFYAAEGRHRRHRAAEVWSSPPPARPPTPEVPQPAPPGPPREACGTEPGSLYLVWEARPQRSLAAYRSLVRRGAPGLLASRAPPPSEPGSRLSLGETGPPPRVERLDEVVRAVRQAGPGAAVLLDGLEYLVARHGFESVLRMLFRLREVAAAQGATLLVPADPRALEPRQRALLERESRVLG
ncbi:MAG: DUF835 domain-containing protein [Halobacteria archaeon]